MLYVMRHGRTDWNDLHKLQGRTDIPLNEAGRQMARDAREQYRDVHFDYCFCSPLIRAKETAEIFLEGRNIEILFDDRLKEMSFGIYEGIQDSFLHPELPINVFFWKPEEYKGVEGGESLEDLYKRTKEFLDEVAMPLVKTGKDVLIIGHGAMNSAILCQVKNVPVKDFWSDGIKNCELKKLC